MLQSQCHSDDRTMPRLTCSRPTREAQAPAQKFVGIRRSISTVSEEPRGHVERHAGQRPGSEAAHMPTHALHRAQPRQMPRRASGARPAAVACMRADNGMPFTCGPRDITPHGYSRLTALSRSVATTCNTHARGRGVHAYAMHHGVHTQSGRNVRPQRESWLNLAYA